MLAFHTFGVSKTLSAYSSSFNRNSHSTIQEISHPNIREGTRCKCLPKYYRPEFAHAKGLPHWIIELHPACFNTRCYLDVLKFISWSLVICHRTCWWALFSKGHCTRLIDLWVRYTGVMGGVALKFKRHELYRDVGIKTKARRSLRKNIWNENCYNSNKRTRVDFQWVAPSISGLNHLFAAFGFKDHNKLQSEPREEWRESRSLTWMREADKRNSSGDQTEGNKWSGAAPPAGCKKWFSKSDLALSARAYHLPMTFVICHLSFICHCHLTISRRFLDDVLRTGNLKCLYCNDNTSLFFAILLKLFCLSFSIPNS